MCVGQVAGQDEDNNRVMLDVGVCVCVCVGQVAGQDEDNNRVMLRLALTGEIINISQHNMQLVSKTDYNKYSKYLSETTYSCTECTCTRIIRFMIVFCSTILTVGRSKVCSNKM